MPRLKASSGRFSSVRRTAQGRQRAKAVIDFIEMLQVPSGYGVGKRFKLQAWQKAFIHDIYGPHRNGKRVVRRAILSVARRNGKTALIAGLALAHLVGPESVMNGEVCQADC
jgi:phage terminase large subunit-like protein